MKNVLVACEESQVVTTAMRNRGINAYSCDILPTSGLHPEWHIQQDAEQVLSWDYWDAVIAFPPCTHLAVSGARHFKRKRESGVQQEAIRFFMLFAECACSIVSIENPVGIMSTLYRKPDQIVHPWMFGDGYEKSTCLWLKGLPLLTQTHKTFDRDIVTLSSGKRMSRWAYDMSCMPHKDRPYYRSKTPHGFAEAIAEQWGEYLR